MIIVSSIKVCYILSIKGGEVFKMIWTNLSK